MKFCIRLPCCVLSKLTVKQFNFACTLLAIASRLTLYYMQQMEAERHFKLQDENEVRMKDLSDIQCEINVEFIFMIHKLSVSNLLGVANENN